MNKETKSSRIDKVQTSVDRELSLKRELQLLRRLLFDQKGSKDLNQEFTNSHSIGQ